MTRLPFVALGGGGAGCFSSSSRSAGLRTAAELVMERVPRYVPGGTHRQFFKSRDLLGAGPSRLL